MPAGGDLRSLANRLLSGDGAPHEQREAAHRLYALFYDLSGRPQDVASPGFAEWQRETLLPNGKAIDPHSAATCILDFARTGAFARGVCQAIRAARSTFPDERIDVLYAGTGPFAPLALLQTAAFTAAQIRFTLVDIHPQALACLEDIVSKLGLGGYVGCYVQADAAAWTPPGQTAYHVIIVEVMQRALTKEPQVAVTLNLAKFLRPGGFLVPESVALRLCLLDPVKEHQAIAREATSEAPVVSDRSVIGTPFELTVDSAGECAVDGDGRIALPSVRLPDDLQPNHQLCIATAITTYGDIALDDYKSGLTLPHLPRGLSGLRAGMELEVWYATRGDPGLRFGPASGP